MVEDFLHCVEMQHSTSGATVLKSNYHKTKHLFGQQLVVQNEQQQTPFSHFKSHLLIIIDQPPDYD